MLRKNELKVNHNPYNDKENSVLIYSDNRGGNGKLDFRTAHTVIPAEYYRKKTVEFLHDNYCYVENSILTEAQRQKIKDKIVF